jgi:hypothetical protein
MDSEQHHGLNTTGLSSRARAMAKGLWLAPWWRTWFWRLNGVHIFWPSYSDTWPSACVRAYGNNGTAYLMLGDQLRSLVTIFIELNLKHQILHTGWFTYCHPNRPHWFYPWHIYSQNPWSWIALPHILLILQIHLAYLLHPNQLFYITIS